MTVQLDRIPPRNFTVIQGGTPEAPSGVRQEGSPGASTELELLPRLDAAGHGVSRPGESEWIAPEIELPRGWFSRARAWGFVLIACAALLGQGEQLRQDARFRSPGAALTTYWAALRDGDMTTVTQCFTDPQASMPFPGMVWFLPPVDSLKIASIHIVSAQSNLITAMYEVQFTPEGTTQAQHFITTSELRRLGREWRIVPPTDQAAMPEWKPYPRTVDS